MVLSDPEVAALGAGRAVVREAVLPPARLAACRAEAERLADAGGLRAAGTGHGAAQHPDLRGDQITWLEADMPAFPHLSALWPFFEALRGALNRDAWLGLRRFELQLACYPPNTRYVRHRDALRGDPRRRLTAILYLNPTDWRPEDGGLLEIWEDGAGTPSQALVPGGGRLILFRSEALLHAVSPTRPSAPRRLAVTAWYRSDEG